MFLQMSNQLSIQRDNVKNFNNLFIINRLLKLLHHSVNYIAIPITIEILILAFATIVAEEISTFIELPEKSKLWEG